MLPFQLFLPVSCLVPWLVCLFIPSCYPQCSLLSHLFPLFFFIFQLTSVNLISWFDQFLQFLIINYPFVRLPACFSTSAVDYDDNFCIALNKNQALASCQLSTCYILAFNTIVFRLQQKLSYYSFLLNTLLLNTLTVTMACLLVPERLVCVYQKLVNSWEFHTHQSLEFT